MATQAASVPFTVGMVVANAGNMPVIRNFSEDAAQTFLTGVPTKLVAGYLQECGAITDAASAVIAGISAEFAHNLASAGVGVPLNYGKVQNQASAVLIPSGAPLALGTLLTFLAHEQTYFIGKTDDAHALAVTDVGTIYGLTKGSNNFWFVDSSKTTTGTGACIEVIALVDAVGTVGGKVLFKITKAAQQFGV